MKFELINIVQELGKKELFKLKCKASVLDLAEEGISEEAIITFNGEAYNCGDEFVVSGSVTVPFKFSCSLCLKECEAELEIPFNEVYKKNYEGDEFQAYKENELDLTQAVYETIVADLPLKPLCSEDCNGLCLRCGAEQNSSMCNCASEYVNPKMSALKKFLD